jgi:hypothetical protein
LLSKKGRPEPPFLAQAPETYLIRALIVLDLTPSMKYFPLGDRISEAVDADSVDTNGVGVPTITVAKAPANQRTCNQFAFSIKALSI